MTTTQEFVEKDELEKFIEKEARASSQNLWNGDSGFSVEQMKNGLHRVAAFSAKRAREKAIEECQAIVSRNFKPHQAEGDWGNAGDTAENIQKQLAELKS
jgi:putative alpha-1,2-mannosidase